MFGFFVYCLIVDWIVFLLAHIFVHIYKVHTICIWTCCWWLSRYFLLIWSSSRNNRSALKSFAYLHRDMELKTFVVLRPRRLCTLNPLTAQTSKMCTAIKIQKWCAHSWNADNVNPVCYTTLNWYCWVADIKQFVFRARKVYGHKMRANNRFSIHFFYEFAKTSRFEIVWMHNFRIAYYSKPITSL